MHGQFLQRLNLEHARRDCGVIGTLAQFINGSLPKEGWEEIIHDGFWECVRVLKPNGTLVFKWNETDIPTRKIIETIGMQPLFWHRSGKAAKTQWMCFLKPEAEKKQVS